MQSTLLMKTTLAGATLAMAAGASLAQFADTPWPTLNRDAQRTGRTTAVGGAAPVVKWTFRMDQSCISGIAIGPDGTIYAGDQSGKIYAVNPDGTEKWRFTSTGFTIHSAGPTIAPDGTIYFGTTQPSALHAINPDGSERWTFPVDSHIYGSANLDDDGVIYLGTREGLIRAIDPGGNQIWQFGNRDTEYFAASPAIGHDGRLYAPTYSSDIHMYCLDRDGNEIWRLPVFSFCYGGAVIDDTGVIYAQDENSLLVAINPDGTVRWLHEGDYAAGHPAVGWDGTIYAGDYGGFFAVAPDGEILWSAPLQLYASHPVVDGAGTIYTGTDTTQEIVALNPDGTIRWRFSTGGHTARCKFAIDDDGTIYTANGAGLLYAIGPGEGQRAEPIDLRIITGQLIEGSIDDIRYSEDRALQAASSPGFRASEPNLMTARILYESPIAEPALLTAVLEGHLDHPTGRGELLLRNWTTGQLDTIGAFALTREEDEVRFEVTQDAAAYVRAADGRIELHVKHIVDNVFRASGFRSFLDVARVSVRGE